MAEPASILIVDDDVNLGRTLQDILRVRGYAPASAASGQAALELARRQPPAVALIDLKLTDMSGLDVLRGLKALSPAIECLVVTGHASQTSAIEAINLGAYSYVQKPYDLEQLLVTVRRLVERREAGEALRVSERRYRQLYENSLDGLVSWDLPGRFLECNSAYAQMLGYSVDELRQLSYPDMTPEKWHAREAQLVEEQILVRGYSGAYEKEYRRKDGTVFPVEISAYLIRDENGQPAGMWSIVRDITERKQAEAALKHRVAQLALLNDLGSRITAKLNVQEVLNSAAQLVQQSFGYHHVALFTLDSHRQVLVMRAKAGTFTQLFPIGHQLKIGQGIVGWVGQQGKSRLANDVSADSDYVNLYSAVIPTQAELCVPIHSGGKVLGALDVQSPQRQAFDDNDVQVMETVANQVAVALDNALLYQAAQHELAERERAKAEIRRLSTFPELNPVPILEISQTGEIIYANPASRADLTRLGETDPRLFLPDDMADIVQAADDKHPVFFREVDIKGRKFGETFYYTPEFQTLRLYARDITERLQAQVALRDSEQRYRTLIENQGEGIAILDDEGGFFFANPAAESIFGVASGSLFGRNVREFLAPAQWVVMDAETQKHLRGEKSAYELEVTRPDGQTRNLLVTAAPQYAADKQFAATFNIFRDITERKQAELALKRLNAELEQRVEERTAELSAANAALAHAARLKDEFLASMSHELRTPLTAILTLSETLQEQVYGPINEKQLSSLRTIENSGRHLLGLINDILDLSKIEAGQLQLQIEACSVKEICQSSLQLVKGLAQKKRQTLAFDCHPENIPIRADARRMKQMLVNLLGNAVKFTPEDGQIGLTVEADEAAQVVRFTVWDTGIGIAAEDLPKLFRPFIQLDSSLARHQAGTGLGLALVQRMADLHGGGVSVESTPGRGSRFTITLPWTLAAPGPAPRRMHTTGLLRQTHRLGHLSAAAGEPPLILVADDNDTNLGTYSDYLQFRGFQVALARQGEETVALAAELRPDLILMDVQMPGMDGLEATRRIRRHPDRQVAATPIIALTALAMPGDRERCLEAGANEYLSKPVSVAVLIKTIETQLTRAMHTAG